VTHPFHPLYGTSFESVAIKQTWGLERVYYHDAQGTLCSLPLAWTSLQSTDPFVAVSAGRSDFRIEDLLALVKLLNALEASRREVADV
jgi:hypothetical protein